LGEPDQNSAGFSYGSEAAAARKKEHSSVFNVKELLRSKVKASTCARGNQMENGLAGATKRTGGTHGDVRHQSDWDNK